ncbi:transglycosylase SLT domain-containing protein [Kocuria palustris]|nr:transglycosylase SLT domain-containing protein [Kocuria palustris]
MKALRSAGVVIGCVLLAFLALLFLGAVGGQKEDEQAAGESACVVTAGGDDSAEGEGGGESGLAGVPNGWGPLVEDAANEAGIPPEVAAAQLNQESRWDPEAGSGAGARGLGQFMPATWESYGDGGSITDPEDSIAAYGRYMKDLKGQVEPMADGDAGKLIELTLAAYNAGPGAVEQHGGVPPYQETQNYVKTITAGGQEEYSTDCKANAATKAWDGDLGDGEWTNPLPGGQFTSGYGHRDISGVPEWAKNHVGVDISTGGAGDVLAPADMEIVEFYEPDACIKGKQKDEPQFYFNLCHLAENYVDEGDEVTRGDVIGVEGNTGQISGMATHLHVEIFKPDSPSPPQPYNGSNIDPEPILKEKGAWPK